MKLIDEPGHAGWFREKPIENILEGDGKTMVRVVPFS